MHRTLQAGVRFQMQSYTVCSLCSFISSQIHRLRLCIQSHVSSNISFSCMHVVKITYCQYALSSCLYWFHILKGRSMMWTLQSSFKEICVWATVISTLLDAQYSWICTCSKHQWVQYTALKRTCMSCMLWLSQSSRTDNYLLWVNNYY